MSSAAIAQSPSPTTTPPPPASLLGELLAIARYHIVLIAMSGMLTFGWLMTGRYRFALALLVGLDWFLINLMNRITDIAEDLRNAIPGTARVARQRRLLSALSLLLLVGSFAWSHWRWPELSPWRLAVQLIGLAYNYRLLPTPRGRSRFKELYFFKNFASAALFILTCFVYPLVVATEPLTMRPLAIGLLALFFLLFEHSYEILYDFRDLDGDRQLGVPTYPVVHGPAVARQILAALLWLPSLVLVGGLGSGVLGVREALMVLAPLSSWLFLRSQRRFERGLTSRDCILLTHLGSLELLLFLLGTTTWQRLGMPPNIYIR
jgi:4-hydroxybenzoate polyprenyltransferase